MHLRASKPKWALSAVEPDQRPMSLRYRRSRVMSMADSDFGAMRVLQMLNKMCQRSRPLTHHSILAVLVLFVSDAGPLWQRGSSARVHAYDNSPTYPGSTQSRVVEFAGDHCRKGCSPAVRRRSRWRRPIWRGAASRIFAAILWIRCSHGN